MLASALGTNATSIYTYIVLIFQDWLFCKFSMPFFASLWLNFLFTFILWTFHRSRENRNSFIKYFIIFVLRKQWNYRAIYYLCELSLYMWTKYLRKAAGLSYKNVWKLLWINFSIHISNDCYRYSKTVWVFWGIPFGMFVVLMGHS